MPFQFGCPQCGAKLKTAKPVAEDRSIQCPKCKHMFSIADTTIQEIGGSKSSVSSFGDEERPQSRRREENDEPVSRRRTSEDKRPSRSRDDDDDDDNDSRSRRRSDNDDDRPRSRQRAATADDDDDDRSRRRRNDEDDEPRSSSRSDEDDDEPRSRRRRDDDDYERPRPRRRKKKRSNKGLIIGLAVLALLAIGGLVALLVWAFGGSNYDKEMLSFLPKDTIAVAGMDMEGMMRFQSAKETLQQPQFREAMDQLKSKLGLTPEDVERAIIGFTDFAANKEPEGTFVVRFKKSVPKDKIIKEMNAQKKDSNGKTYYAGLQGKGCLYFPADDLLVVTSSETTMTNKTLKSDGSIQFSEELQEMAKPVSKNLMWGAMVVTPEMRKAMQSAQQAKAMVGVVSPKLAELIDFLPKAKGFAFFIHDDGSEGKLGLGMKLTDSAEADRFAATAKDAVTTGIEQLMNLMGAQGMPAPEDVKKFVSDTAKKTTTERQGDVGFVVIRIDDKEYQKIADKYKNQLNNMNGPMFGVPGPGAGPGFGGPAFGPPGNPGMAAPKNPGPRPGIKRK